MKIYFIRHGHADHNAAFDEQQNTDVYASHKYRHSGLTSKGIGQIEAVKLPEKPQRVYCSPLKRCIQTARIIFGEEEAGALQPYGKYWRLGANEASTFENNQSIWFNDKELAAGKYAIYAYPGLEKWVIAVNKDWDRWGAQEPDLSLELLRTEVTANNQANFQELFDISFSEPDSSGNTKMILHWDKELIQIPLRKK